ncbi:hypothetical protein [Kitasatospora sp. McL0602]|uniref:hypothetical protein n=1 Tax=Kitasatospora sp. McL0602 TaxID=3439530 RepID=UPI003F8A34A4
MTRSCLTIPVGLALAAALLTACSGAAPARSTASASVPAPTVSTTVPTASMPPVAPYTGGMHVERLDADGKAYAAALLDYVVKNGLTTLVTQMGNETPDELAASIALRRKQCGTGDDMPSGATLDQGRLDFKDIGGAGAADAFWQFRHQAIAQFLCKPTTAPPSPMAS